MNHNCKHALQSLCLTTALLFGIIAYAADDVTHAANSASTSVTHGQSDTASTDPSKQCTYHMLPVRDGTGDQWCMMKNGMVIGRVHYEMNKATGNYEQTLTRLKTPVSSGVLTAGGRVDSDGNVTLPANAQAGWDKVDRIKAEGAARMQAEAAASQATNADKAMIRKAAMEKCKPLIKGGDAQMTAFKACFKEATQ